MRTLIPAMGWWGRTILTTTCIAIVALYGWIAGTTDPDVALGAEKASEAYYNLLVDGFLSGQLNLKKAAPPELAQMPNPYDPARNAPYRVYDASYYKGKLFLYFGIVPALLLFLPSVLLTGGYLWHAQAVAIFSALGFLLSTVLACRICRRYFPAVHGGIVTAGAVILGFASVVPVMLRRPDLWEVPISCAYLLVMASLAGVWRALHESGGRQIRWLAAASAFYGLALGARPSMLFGAVILLIPVACAWREGAGEAAARRRRIIGLLTAAIIPIGLGGAGLMLYNALRFDNPFEFGLHYQLVVGKDQSQLRQFMPNYEHIWFNLRAYFFREFRWNGYFPFVLDLGLPPIPADSFNVEEPFAVLSKVPVVWLALAVPLAWRGRSADERWRLGGFIAGIFLLFLGGAIPVCLLPGCCVRYQVDYMPALALLAVIALLGIERALVAQIIWRWLARLGWTVLLAWSVIASFSASCEYWDLFRTQRPQAYHAVARILNRPSWWLERLGGSQTGPWEIKLQFPSSKTGAHEPLIVTGAGGKADYLYVNYADSQHVIIGLEHTGYAGQQSSLIPVDYGREHILVVEMGSLYPPADHPYFADPAAADTFARTKRLRVQLDGEVVIDRPASFFEASPRLRFLGVNPSGPGRRWAFTGKILSFKRLSPPVLPPAGSGAVNLTVQLAGRPAENQGEPLVVTGERGRGDVLYVRSVGEGRVVFGFDHWGAGGPESEPQVIDFKRSHALEIHMGSLYPPAPAAEPGPDDPMRHHLLVKLDGREIMAGRFNFHPATSARVYVGMNPIEATSASPYFTGRITGIHRGD